MYDGCIYNPESTRADAAAMQIRTEAQSILCKDGRVPPMPSYDEAVLILHQARTEGDRRW